MLRFGLCCIFREQPIRFVNTTATSIARLERTEALAKLSRLCLANADSLLAALQFCSSRGIGCFPQCWRDRDLTVEVEAKAKEVAVLQLIERLAKRKKRLL
jgi:UV DNA damage repair endonuclease